MSGTVVHDGAEGFEVRFPYNPRLVDLVKGLPERRWNRAEKCWWVPLTGVVDLVDLVRPEGFSFDDETLRLYEDKNPGDYTVGRLNREVQRVLKRGIPGALWVVGEISGYDKWVHRATAGRPLFFTLVESGDGGGAVAKVSCRLFGRERERIQQRLVDAGEPFELQDEITVRLKVRVDLYVPHGSYQIVVDDIDVAYTLGEAARRREEILRKLTAEGLTERNRSLPLPLAPLRVGLITSLDSDAYNDVIRTLQEAAVAFEVVAHGARVQGRHTEASILNAVTRLQGHAPRLDVLLLCRGGGSRTDLAWLDSEAIARAVATCPVPVVVGVGHEQDRSVLDAVARSCKTPTAAAALLVERVTETVVKLEGLGELITGVASERLRQERAAADHRARRLATVARGLVRLADRQLAQDRRRLASSATQLLGRHRDRLERLAPALTRAAHRTLDQGRARLEELPARLRRQALAQLALEYERTAARQARLALADPARVLERGYAILRDAETGAVVRATGDAAVGTRLHARVADGSLHVVVEGHAETEDGR